MGIGDVIAFRWDEPVWASLAPSYQGQPLVLGPYTALTAEHMFQALKATTAGDYRRVLSQATPGEAKALGSRLLRCRQDWQLVRLEAMSLVLSVKFRLKRDEGAELMDTGDSLLAYVTHADPFWGYPMGDADADALPTTQEGRNWLGRLLMARRSELWAEAASGFRVDYAPTFEAVRWRPTQ